MKNTFRSTENTFQSKKNLVWFPRKCFPFILSGKHFPKVVKNLDLVLKLLIAIYILFWIFIFQFHPLEFNFYINFGPHFYNCYLFFSYHFLIEIFYILNLVLILLIVTYFIWYNLWNVNYYYFNFFIFYYFYFLDLIFIILIIIYFIWDNLWNFFFSISFSLNFLIWKICSSIF